jgi:hypothetical protein
MSLLVRGNGMTNANSRFATMQAMSDSFSFRIDPYKDWTVDWSSKDGYYFSNKAPGPMFLGFPIYFVTTKLSAFFRKEAKTQPPSSSIRSFLNLTIQVLPILMFMILMTRGLLEKYPNKEDGLFIGLLLILFGNTTSLFYNSYFGHGIAGAFSIGILYFYLKKDFLKVGFCFGFTLLSDYGAAFFLIPLIFLLGKKENWKNFIIGGLLPGLLWCWYHYSVTGSIFELPNKYINPLFREESKDLLWNMFSYPKLEYMVALLFGPQKGILYTQPWAFLALPMIIKKIFEENKKEVSGIFVITVIGFILVLLMNSSFNGWHGGATSGPRYLCIVLVQLAFCMIFIWNSLSRALKITFLFLIAYTLIFRALIYATNPMISENVDLYAGIWSFLKEEAGIKQFIRVPIFLGLMGFATFKSGFHKKLFKVQ